MADIEKIKVGNTSYDVRDASAAHSLDEIAIAGSNIEFQSSPFTNYTVVGSNISINSNYEMTRGGDTNYVYFDYLLSQSPTSFEFVTAVNPQNYVNYIGILGPVGSQYGINLQLGSGRKPQLVIGDGISAPISILGNTGLTAEQKSYIKIAYDSSNGYTLSSSTDGENWTPQGTSSSTILPNAVSYLMLGYNGTNSLGNSTIYLADTYMKENGQVIWSAVDTSSRKKINATDTTYSAFTGADGANAGTSGLVPAPTSTDNAKFLRGDGTWAVAGGTVDQTYNAYSANAQSGVAINGANFVRNTAYGTGSFVIGGTDSTHNNYLTQIGSLAKAKAVSATAVGYNAQATGAHSIAFGSNTGASGDNGISIGYYTQAPGDNSIGIGGSAQGNYSIQLGYGTNGTANTFSVGLSNNLNVRLLDSSGNIPGPRMALQGAAAPDTTTAGSVGQFYIDTTNQDAYICVSDASSTYTWKKITP